MRALPTRRPPSPATYRHEALLYAGEDEFVARVGSFVRKGVRARESVLVVVSARKIDRLRAELGAEAANVEFADMREVGTNPARIIPAWREFVDGHQDRGRNLRGVGEPIDPERSPEALIECHGHEALLNISFDTRVPLWLLCPYDTSALDAATISQAQRTHQVLTQGKTRRQSLRYLGPAAATAPFDAPLGKPPPDASILVYDVARLGALRGLVSRRAAAVGFSPSAIEDLAFAVNELATNSVRHGGGAGTLRLWQDGDELVCELRDSGHMGHKPLVGRERPTEDGSARGLWLANQLCDLVQLRSSPEGTVARLHARRH